MFTKSECVVNTNDTQKLHIKKNEYNFNLILTWEWDTTLSFCVAL